MTDILNGRRRPDLRQNKEGWSPLQSDVRPGDYWKLYKKDGSVEWYACIPGGFLGNLSAHEITEHEDGTITASPSILTADGHQSRWHGYLERGKWRQV